MNSTFFTSSISHPLLSLYPCKVFNPQTPDSPGPAASNNLCEICQKDEKMFLLRCITCNLSVHSHCYMVEAYQDPWQCQGCLNKVALNEQVECKTCGQSKGALRLYPKGWFHVICKKWPSHKFVSEGICWICKKNSGKFVNCEVCWEAFHPFCGFLNGLRNVAGRISCDEHFGFENIKDDFGNDLKVDKNERAGENGDEPKKKRKIEDFFELSVLKIDKEIKEEKELNEINKPEIHVEDTELNKIIEKKETKPKSPKTKSPTIINESNKSKQGKVFKGLMELRSSRNKVADDPKLKPAIQSSIETTEVSIQESKVIKDSKPKVKKEESSSKEREKNEGIKLNDKKPDKKAQIYCLNQNIAKTLKVKAKGTIEEIHQRIEDYLFLNCDVISKGYRLSKNMQKVFGVKEIPYKDVRDVLIRFCSVTS